MAEIKDARKIIIDILKQIKGAENQLKQLLDTIK